MNNNNLNWSENRVVGNAGAAQSKSYKDSPITPYRDNEPSGLQDTSRYRAGQGGVSPSTYQMLSDTAADRERTITRNSAYAPDPEFDIPGPPSVMDPGYIPGYLKTLIGKRIRAEFVFENLYLDKTGIMREVGYNYFVLEDNTTGAMIMCDLYSTRFVTSV